MSLLTCASIALTYQSFKIDHLLSLDFRNLFRPVLFIVEEYTYCFSRSANIFTTMRFYCKNILYRKAAVFDLRYFNIGIQLVIKSDRFFITHLRLAYNDSSGVTLPVYNLLPVT